MRKQVATMPLGPTTYRTGLVTVLLLVGSLGGWPALAQPTRQAAEPVTQSFTLQHRNAKDLVRQVQQLVGDPTATRVFVDAQSNQIVVRGPAAQRSLASTIIRQLDQPLAKLSPTARLQAYPVPTELRGPIDQWARKIGGGGTTRAAWDARTGQLLVYGPPELHAQVGERLRGQTAPDRSTVVVRDQPSPPVRDQPSTPVGRHQVRLSTLTAEHLHTRLERLAGRALPAKWDAGRRQYTFPVKLEGGSGVQLRVDSVTRVVELAGSRDEVEAWSKVIAALDAAPSPDQPSTGVVASKNARGPKLREALGAIGARGGGVNAQQVTMLMQNEDPASPAEKKAPNAATDSAVATAEALADSALLGPVQIEFIEGLDIIVVRGNEDDVQRVMGIINQIETLSQVTVPEIQIYPLAHVDSVSMGRLMQRVYQDVLGPRTGSVSITPLGKPDALLLIGRKENVQTAIDLVKQLDQPLSPTARMQTFRLKFANAEEAQELITSYFATEEGGGADQPSDTGALLGQPLVVADRRSNTLIARAAPRDMLEIAELVKRIDQPADAQAELKVFTIKNGDAEALADMLSSLFGTDTTDDEGGLGAAGSSLAPLQIAFDQRTNSIVAAGSIEDLAIVEAVLLRLDQDGLRDRQTRVFRLNNAFAPDVATALNQLLEDQRDAEQSADLTISPFEQIDREVIIVAEQATNTLIISANPDEFSQVERLLNDLDARPPMVMVQVLIAEVRLNDTDEFGIELGLQDSLLFDRSLVGELRTITVSEQENIAGAVVTQTEEVVVDAPLTPGFNFNDVLNPLGNNGSTSALATAGATAAQGLTNFAVGRANDSLGFGGFVLSASSNSISTLLRALQENRRLEVLSRPQVMMLDNQQGLISVGQQVPLIQSSSINQFGQQINNFDYQNVGIELDVTPRISPDDTVVMNVLARRSAVGEEADGIPVFITPGGQVVRTPPIDQVLAQTTVSAASGQTIILSGLLTKDTFDVHRSVPLLADIPLLGDLFRYDSVAEQRTELLIIMTPRVVRNQEDAEQIKQIEAARMSWVMSDVVNIHGPSGLRARDDEWTCEECEEVYPTHVPGEEPHHAPNPVPAPPQHGPSLHHADELQFPVQPTQWSTTNSDNSGVAPRRLPAIFK